MDNLINTEQWDFDIAKIELKIFALFAEMNEQYSTIATLICKENINRKDELAADEYLSNMLEKLNIIKKNAYTLNSALWGERSYS